MRDTGARDELQGAATHPQPHGHLDVLSAPKLHLLVETACVDLCTHDSHAMYICTHVLGVLDRCTGIGAELRETWRLS